MTGISAPSMTAQRFFAAASVGFNSSLEKLATGSRINRASDDPAGLISSEQLRAALASLEAESRSVERADAVANTADGALAEISSLLSDANAATVAMANTAGMSQAERDAYQMEIDSAKQAIDRIASTTTFNGQKLLDGSTTLAMGDSSVTIRSASTADLGIAGSAMADPEAAQQSIAAAISSIATMRGEIGAFQSNTLNPMHRANSIAIESTAAAYSSIRDTNYAAETANLSRAQLLTMSSMRALALSNAAPRHALHFLS